MNIRIATAIATASLATLLPVGVAVGSAAPTARDARQPIAQSVIIKGHLASPTKLVVGYVVAGNTSYYSDRSTGEPIIEDGAQLGSISVFIDGKSRGGSDSGWVKCAPGAPVAEYYDQFRPLSFQVTDSESHLVRVRARYCAPDGTVHKTIQRLVVK